MLRDPFGDWDWEAISELLFGITVLALLISLVGHAEGDWKQPWEMVLDVLQDNLTITLIVTILGLMALWHYEELRGGD